MPDWDVVILGAGPAGSSAAIQCARHGLRVALIERAAFPRQAVGETLHPGIFPLLTELGVESAVLAAGFLRHAGFHIQWNEPERYAAFGEDATGSWLGLQAWRPDFDAILLDRARALGARVYQPEQVLRAVFQAGQLTGVETATGMVTAPYVVDATGRWRWLAQQLNLEMILHGPRRVAWYGYAEGECTTRAESPALRADPEGWTWIARVRPSLYQWTRLNFDNRRPPENWLPEELLGLRRDGPVCGADVTWQIAAEPAGPSYFLVGDAACVLDPASSHGVLKAIMSGMMAGYLIARVRRGEVSPEQAAQHYSHWLKEWYAHDVRRLTDLYALL